MNKQTRIIHSIWRSEAKRRIHFDRVYSLGMRQNDQLMRNTRAHTVISFKLNVLRAQRRVFHRH